MVARFRDRFLAALPAECRLWFLPGSPALDGRLGDPPLPRPLLDEVKFLSLNREAPTRSGGRLAAAGSARCAHFSRGVRNAVSA